MNRAGIDDDATAWVAREDARPLAAEEAAELERWLDEDPRHAGAYARARAVFAEADRASALGPGFDPQRFAGTPHRRHARTRAWWASAAAVLALAAGALLWMPQRGDGYRTMLGEIRHLPLADGSVMTLNTDSRVRVRFDEGLRRIELLRGEALFDVAHDPGRPFVVDTGDTRVRAVGTRFNVRRLPGKGAEVVVTEGRVEVSGDRDDAATPAVLLEANQRVVARAGRQLRAEPIADGKLEQVLSWRDGMLAFDGDTLAQAAGQFARYGPVRLRFDDPSVARLRVVGLYAASDPDGFARAVALSQDLQYQRDGNDIFLRKNQPQPAPRD